MTKPRKYGNDYPDSFVPTYTWHQVEQMEKEREEQRAKKIRRRRKIDFSVMNGWARFFHLSVEKPRLKFIRRILRTVWAWIKSPFVEKGKL